MNHTAMQKEQTFLLKESLLVTMQKQYKQETRGNRFVTKATI
jgi:hypothetical protein